MTDIPLEIIRAIITGSICVYLLSVGKNEDIRHQKGWSYIIAGFGLIFFGTLVDITDNFPSLNQYLIVGDTAYQAFLEKVVGYLLGFLLLAIGLAKWMPTIIMLRHTQNKLKKSHDEMESKVKERTVELKAINERLEQKIIERKDAEHALQISENNLVKAQEVAHIGSWHLDLLTNNLVWTDENYRIFGIPGGTPVTYEKFLEVLHPEDRDYVAKRWNAAIDGEPYDIEHRLLIDNEVKWVREKAELNFDDDGNPVSGVGITQDITGRKRTEEALKESEKRFRDIAENAVIWIWEVDREGRYTYANPEVEQVLGYRPEEVVGKYFSDFLAPEERDAIEEKLKGVFASKEAFLNVVSTKVRKNGVAVVCETSGVPILDGHGELVGYRGSVNDITDRKRLEAELLKAQKLESVGLLAGGIAHDFNNLLTGIIGNISLAKTDLGSDAASERLTAAENATDHAVRLARQLLTFSKGGAPRKETAYIKNLIKDSVSLSLIGSKIRHEYSIQEDLWPVDMDTGQINQVISNIAINARHAMPEGGLLKVGAESITIGADKEDIMEGLLKEGRYIKISVEDNGTGIDKKHLDKIFDPYFTTKEEGSGLGLATSYSIIKKHGGHIKVESQPGAGTTFCVYLPASKKEVPRDKAREEIITSPKGTKHKGIKVLVMDDEKIIRDVAGAMLTSFGYGVGFATEGNEAVELYRKAQESGEPFGVVIMDLTIAGGLGGEAAMKKLLDIDPGAKVIVSSGYSDDPIMSDYKNYAFSDVIAKPYKAAELRAKIQKVIAAED